MAKETKILILEEWIRSNSGCSKSRHDPSSSSPAQAIIQAWAELRNCYQLQSFDHRHLEFLKTLLNSKTSLHVADPQAKLLISFLSSPNISLPCDSYPLFFRLLYIWIRKSSKPSFPLVDLSVGVLSHLFTSHIHSKKSLLTITEGSLLLGALSCLPAVSQSSKTVCLELLCGMLENKYKLICCQVDLIPEIFASIGYALSSSRDTLFDRVLNILLKIWSIDSGICACISSGLMILHLVEWVLSIFFSSHSLNTIEIFTTRIFGVSKQNYVPFTLVMAAAGILRACSRSSLSGLKLETISRLRTAGEEIVEEAAKVIISKTKGFTNFVNDPSTRFDLQCISLALSRCGPVSCRPPLLICIASALLTEIVPLKKLYTTIVNHGHSKAAHLGLDDVKKHLDSVIFKEAGAAAFVLCNQYAAVDEENMNAVENLIWTYCEDIYWWHRRVAFVLRGNKDELLVDLEKIAESAFLMLVVFALAVTKHRFTKNFTLKCQIETSVNIMVSFSCVEYFRRMRLSEYMDTIRAVVGIVQENESACVSFVKSMPSYYDVTNQQGFEKMEYEWSKDDVQTARILFYLRVLPTCIERVPASIFKEVLAPTMFLYLGHQNRKVARASHLMFVAFMSSGKDSDQDERILLKEQLVFFYIQRSLEGFPGITPFDGLASGVAALVRHLPAGNPATFYCLNGLVQRTRDLCRDDLIQDVNSLKNRVNESKPSKQLIDLLLKLTTLVDVQVLPNLLMLVAEVITELRKDAREIIIGEIYSLVAESEDVTRKPLLISWLHSLSYILFQATPRL